MKQMLSVDEQLQHMKHKGITFHEVSEDEARDFLLHNNYYMKLAAYRENYAKCTSGQRSGQYINLDFGYLKELSTIDMHLRYHILQMCLDIEHAIKVQLLSRIESNPLDDGYEGVKRFLAGESSFQTLRQIQNRKSGEYCKDLIARYYPYFPAWVFVEVISFGTLLHFCTFYAETYQIPFLNNAHMNIVRDFRNAAAHSNCLINRIPARLDSTKQPHSDITKFVGSMPNISPSSRKSNLHSKFAYNMVTLLYVYDALVSLPSKKKRYDELTDFMNQRVCKNASYFVTNEKLCSTYRFLKKVLDNLHDAAYNGVHN